MISQIRWRATLVAAFLFLALPPASRASDDPLQFQGGDSAPFLGGRVGSAVSEAMHPAYVFAEGISDGIYRMLRSHLIAAVLPDAMARNLGRSPRKDSQAQFESNLHRGETRYLQRVRDAFPEHHEADVQAGDARLRQWQTWAGEEQLSVLIDAFRDTMVQRHDLEGFGKASGRYALDSRNWDPSFLATAGILGGAFLYVNGLHASTRVGAVHLGLDVRSGLKIRNSMREEGDLTRLAGLELGYKDKPLRLATEWGLNRGNFRNEQVGLKYSLRY